MRLTENILPLLPKEYSPTTKRVRAISVNVNILKSNVIIVIQHTFSNVIFCIFIL